MARNRLDRVCSDFPADRRKPGLSRRQFVQRLAGLSLGAASLDTLAACQTRVARSAQKRLPLVGYFGTNTEESDAPMTSALREGLQALGYREGRTIHLEWRFANNDQARWPAIARDLVDLHPGVIVVTGIFPIASVLTLSRTVSVVVVLPQVLGAEPLIQLGYIKSQAHPGGNLTGLVGGTSTLAGKRLDLLHEALPGATRLATLRDASQPDPYYPYPGWTSHVVSLGILRAEELDGIVARFEQEGVDLLAIASSGGRMFPWVDRLGEQTLQHRLPAIGDRPAFAPMGGLMSYAADQPALYHGAGRFVDKILKGASPAELPIELPSTLRLVINQKTARTLGLTIPPGVLAQATEVLR